MKPIQKGICVFLTLIFTLCAALSPNNLVPVLAASAFEKQLAAFPESYHAALRALHETYPNWQFIADEINLTLSEAVELEQLSTLKTYKVVPKSYSQSWFSMENGAYRWDKNTYVAYDTSWYVASREVIQYYMDPRNFLNATQIYAYMNLSYNEKTQTEDGLSKIIKGTFLEKGYSDPNDTAYGGSYAKVIMAAAKQTGVSPYVLAATIIQEQGTGGTSSLISGTYSGYEGYYNFFNIGTYGDTNAAKIKAGLTYAKNNGWNSRSKSIIGGAQFCANGYVSAGQNTYFYMNYNIKNTNRIYHQYATAVYNADSSGRQVAKTYQDLKNATLDFYIPVYKNMPTKVSAAPAKTDKKNNYYFQDILVEGLTPSFDRYTYNYDLSVSGDTFFSVDVPDGAAYAGESSYELKKGKNTVTLKVKSETGYTTSYKISVLAEKDCVFSLLTEASNMLRGDTNGDGKINGRDLANIQMHILEIKSLTGHAFTGGDTNGDGKINGRDLANVQMDILDIKKLN